MYNTQHRTRCQRGRKYDAERKILIVDDDIEIRKIVSIYLKNEGYEIIDASDAIEALETLRNTTIDLIILDIMLPNVLVT